MSNPKNVERAIEEHACNAVLLKVNQVGSMTEAIKWVLPPVRERSAKYNQKVNNGYALTMMRMEAFTEPERRAFIHEVFDSMLSIGGCEYPFRPRAQMVVYFLICKILDIRSHI
ncbi:unnamed protein product [Lactuca virosa]|uniref:phosphopyruvate hydratase n=1 Tax=Lactuca virosa TaxID=75947 RepID=A0AAU9LBG4_9ASTR|nr:unnamed protein product [Lactuca virosa]